MKKFSRRLLSETRIVAPARAGVAVKTDALWLAWRRTIHSIGTVPVIKAGRVLARDASVPNAT